MSWKSGSRLFAEIIEGLEASGIDASDRKAMYEVLIPAFEQFDCDTLYDCVGVDKAFDDVYHGMYPPEDDDVGC